MDKDNLKKAASTYAEFGLHCLRPGSSGTCIIFVHGILSSGETAWGSPSWPSLVEQDADLIDFGIYVFTFRTSVSSRTYSISDAADALREHLTLFGLLDVSSLVFVCHSMGGIVVRRFLVSNQGRLIDRNLSIGLFLVASPSLGSKDANMLSALSFALQHTQAAVLRFSQANTSLDELHRDFKILLHGRRLCIVGRELIEDRPIKIKRFAGLWRQVVEPFSAAAYFHHEGHEPLRIPGSDHSTIVKPERSDALQNVMLKRFLVQLPHLLLSQCGAELKHEENPSKEVVQSQPVEQGRDAKISRSSASILEIDEITRSAISAERLDSHSLPSADDDPATVYRFALSLRSGRMLERILSATLVKQHRYSGAVLRCALEGKGKDQQREIELAAPWMRFASDSVVQALKRVMYDQFTDDDVNSIRLKAHVMGWAGETLLPVMNWSQRYHQEKFSWYFAKAHLHAAWRDQSERELQYLVHMCLDACSAYKVYYNREVSIFDFLSAVKGIPASNSKVILDGLRKDGAPPDLIRALLYRMCLTPSQDALDTIKSFTEHSNSDVTRAAKLAIAFIPARSESIRRLKTSLLTGAEFAAAVGVDLTADATAELRGLLTAGAETSYFAAWALTKLVGNSSSADKLIQDVAVEHTDKLVRCICLVGLAIKSPNEWASRIADEYESARDLEKFCLSIALTYTSDVRPLLALLASTGEDRLYVPYMQTCFQLLFRDALKHASATSPILGEMLALTDDQ